MTTQPIAPAISILAAYPDQHIPVLLVAEVLRFLTRHNCFTPNLQHHNPHELGTEFAKCTLFPEMTRPEHARELIAFILKNTEALDASTVHELMMQSGPGRGPSRH